jgi:hypothetical protein
LDTPAGLGELRRTRAERLAALAVRVERGHAAGREERAG